MHILFVLRDQKLCRGPYRQCSADEAQCRYDTGDISGIAVIGAGLIPQDQQIYQSTGSTRLCQLIQQCQQRILHRIAHQDKHQERIHHGPDSLVHGIFLFIVGIAVHQFLAAAKQKFFQFFHGLYDVVRFCFL